MVSEGDEYTTFTNYWSSVLELVEIFLVVRTLLSYILTSEIHLECP